MPAHPFALQFIAHYFFVVFGLITVVGGIIGFRKAASLPSLIAGGVSGALLLIAGVLLRGEGAAYTTGEVMGLVLSLLLLGRFAPSLARRKLNPAGYIVPLAAVGVVLAVLLIMHAVPR